MFAIPFQKDCNTMNPQSDRRQFLSMGAAAIPVLMGSRPYPEIATNSAAETAVKGLFESLTDDQKKVVCFDWNHTEKQRGLLRTHVSNNWQITKPTIQGEFYTKKQQDLIHEIFKGMINPQWYPKFLKQLKEDTGGKPWGAEQSIAIFGTPGSGKFEFVMTGRHMTLRADGNSEDHVAFGGPIFYGHASQSFNEKPGHPGNVFWNQALLANKVFELIDPKDQKRALVEVRPDESAVNFRGSKGMYTGIPVKDLASEQTKVLQEALQGLIDPFRKEDQNEAIACLNKQGGLKSCYLSYYKEGNLTDGLWDNWRLEGPSFVWYFRGTPHVHVWVNVADSPEVPLNARG